MKRLDGNSLLIIDGDESFCEETSKVFTTLGAQSWTAKNTLAAIELLGTYDFDVVICSYYLPDGLIYQVIDWCKEHLDFLPIFVALGSGIPIDENILKQHLISGFFPKLNLGRIIQSVQGVVFDYNHFYDSLISMVENQGMKFEIITKDNCFEAIPSEMNSKGIILYFEGSYLEGANGLLRVSLFEGRKVENFILMGCYGRKTSGGQFFSIGETYLRIWQTFLGRLEQRQLEITRFLGKAAGF